MLAAAPSLGRSDSICTLWQSPTPCPAASVTLVWCCCWLHGIKHEGRQRQTDGLRAMGGVARGRRSRGAAGACNGAGQCWGRGRMGAQQQWVGGRERAKGKQEFLGEGGGRAGTGRKEGVVAGGGARHRMWAACGWGGWIAGSIARGNGSRGRQAGRQAPQARAADGKRKQRKKGERRGTGRQRTPAPPACLPWIWAQNARLRGLRAPSCCRVWPFSPQLPRTGLPVSAGQPAEQAGTSSPVAASPNYYSPRLHSAP